MNEATLLHRQINPSFIREGRVTSQAFRPTPKDEHRLSVYDGDQIDPAAAYRHYIAQPDVRSVGSQSLTFAECAAAGVTTQSDPEPFPQHAVVVFDATWSNGKTEKVGKKLRKAAADRGWTDGPISEA